MKKKMLFVFVLILVSTLLTGCFNEAADAPGIWWNPFSWGNQTLEVSLAKECAQGASQATIENNIYDCPSQTTPESQAPTTKSATCPTEREFFELTGVIADIEREEACTFHWRGDPQTITPTKLCTNGWICTVGMASWQGVRQTVVFNGDDSLATGAIFSATWRLVGTFPVGDAVYDSCAFLTKVQAEGGRNSDPQWTAVAGNFTCP